MTYFLVLLGVLLTLGREYLNHRRFKRLERNYFKLANALNSNANIVEDLRAIINATGVINNAQDNKYIERVNYMKTHLKAHKNDPQNHPLEIAAWLEEFEFAFQ